MSEGISPARRWSLEWALMTQAILTAQTLLICAALLVPQDFLKAHSHHFYLVHYLLFLPFFLTAKDRCAFLFSPSFLIISYISISFIIGGFAFSHGYVLLPKDLADFRRWNHFNVSTAYFMACNLIAALAYFLASRKRRGTSLCRTGGSLRMYVPQLIVGGLILAVFFLIRVRLDFLGGVGSFSTGPRAFGALVICMVLAKSRWRHRFPAYLALLLLFAAFQYSNRRNILLLGLSIVFLEAAHLQHLRITLRRFLVFAAILVLACVLQLTMTLARGVSGFKGTYWQTLGGVKQFIELDNVIAVSLKQTEGPTTFFHAYNGLNYILEDRSLLGYGGTLARILFLAVPRDFWPDKPKSMVQIYSYRWDPVWTSQGCSTVINLYAEYFWNFHVFGVLCVLPIFLFFNRYFFFYLDRFRAGTAWPFVYLGVGYNFLLVYARGQGLETLAVYVAFCLLIQLLLFNPLTSILRLGGGTAEPRRGLLAGASAGREGECPL